jgi:uncharacterized iron-regulated membrane protein
MEGRAIAFGNALDSYFRKSEASFMGAFDIVRLVGACIALILGAIVFLVVFFRGMSWLDSWIKNRTKTDLGRTQGKRTSKRRSKIASNRSKSLKAESLSLPMRNESMPQRHVREQLAIPQSRMPRLMKTSSAATSDSQIAIQEQAASEVSSFIDLPTKTVETLEEQEPISKTPSRIATVHLLSGETIERVAFCSKERAKSICEGLGFVGVVLENDEGQICVVRENNIKMVIWKKG